MKIIYFFLLSCLCLLVACNEVSPDGQGSSDNPKLPVPEAVDLGLSVKWASFNVGASAPEDYGNYFAWGETKPKDDYSWETYKWCKGDWDSMTKYSYDPSFGYNGFTDGKTVLAPEDDAAAVNLGGKWRMPTYDEIEDLKNNCTWIWTTLNGAKGWKVTSNKEGYTDKWIFLPAAGYRDGASLNSAGSHGWYWSSSLDSNYQLCADVVAFYSDDVLSIDDGSERFSGFSVRPVFGDIIRVNGIALDKTNVTLTSGAAVVLTVKFSPGNATEKGVVWQTSNATVASAENKGIVVGISPGVATITARSVDGGHTATCTVAVTDQIAMPEPVDLGLNVKWASFNLGASAPEEYGAYYAWGETEPKTKEASLATYKWCMNGDFRQLTKYCNNSSYGYNGFTDGKTVLEPEDDAAAVNLGGKWRMPTYDEIGELRTQCTWTWTTLNGVYGMKVTSKKVGYTEKWIFLPATSLYASSEGDVGLHGDYLSPSLFATDPSCAFIMIFNSNYVYWGLVGTARWGKKSVRPVFSE